MHDRVDAVFPLLEAASIFIADTRSVPLRHSSADMSLKRGTAYPCGVNCVGPPRF